jgi:hypothetical protein
MLMDQDFVMPPIFGVGPEIFAAPETTLGIDPEVVSIFTRELQPSNTFRFAFVARKPSKYGDLAKMAALLQQLGVKFSFVLVLNPDLGGHRELVQLSHMWQMLYSPELVGSLMLPTCVIHARPKAVVDTLAFFCMKPESFDLAHFEQALEDMERFNG